MAQITPGGKLGTPVSIHGAIMLPLNQDLRFPLTTPPHAAGAGGLHAMPLGYCFEFESLQQNYGA